MSTREALRRDRQVRELVRTITPTLRRLRCTKDGCAERVREIYVVNRMSKNLRVEFGCMDHFWNGYGIPTSDPYDALHHIGKTKVWGIHALAQIIVKAEMQR